MYGIWEGRTQSVWTAYRFDNVKEAMKQASSLASSHGRDFAVIRLTDGLIVANAWGETV